MLLLEFLLNFSPHAKDRRGFINSDGKIALNMVDFGAENLQNNRARSSSRVFSTDKKQHKDAKIRGREREEDLVDDFRPLLREIFMMDYVVDPEL